MDRRFKVVVENAFVLTGNKNTLEYQYTEETPWGAINFACGLVEGLEWLNGYIANRPHVQSTDGYWWRFERGAGRLQGLQVRVEDVCGRVVDNKTEGFSI